MDMELYLKLPNYTYLLHETLVGVRSKARVSKSVVTEPFRLQSTPPRQFGQGPLSVEAIKCTTQQRSSEPFSWYVNSGKTTPHSVAVTFARPAEQQP